MRSVFVTGANGYVGRHVAREFIRRGYRVAGLVRSASAAQALTAIGAIPVHGELENPESYEAAAVAADVIIHAGFSYTEGGEERTDVDRAATEALLTFAAQGRKPRSLIYTASVFRYGPGTGEYTTEQSSVPLDPADWRHAISERVLSSASDSLRTAVIRLGWVFGSDGGTLPEAISSLVVKETSPTMASNRIPLIDVEDLARLYVDVSQGEGGIFHGCEGRPITVGELAAIAKDLEIHVEPRSDGAESHFASIFERDIPAISLHRPPSNDLADRVAASICAPIRSKT